MLFFAKKKNGLCILNFIKSDILNLNFFSLAPYTLKVRKLWQFIPSVNFVRGKFINLPIYQILKTIKHH